MRPERRGETQGKREIAQFHTPTFLLEERKVGRRHAVILNLLLIVYHFFYIHGSIHHETNLITVQQDVTVFISSSAMRGDGSRPG